MYPRDTDTGSIQVTFNSNLTRYLVHINTKLTKYIGVTAEALWPMIAAYNHVRIATMCIDMGNSVAKTSEIMIFRCLNKSYFIGTYQQNLILKTFKHLAQFCYTFTCKENSMTKKND